MKKSIVLVALVFACWRVEANNQLTLDSTTGKVINFKPCVSVIHADGSTSYYQPAANTDVARGNSLKAAVTASASPDTVRPGTGIFDLSGGQIILGSGVSLKGAGMAATTIQSSIELGITTGKGAIVVPGTNSTVSDLTVKGTAAPGIYQAPIGRAKDAEPTFTNATLINVGTDGDSDAAYLRGTGSLSMRAFNCIFRSKFDGVTILSGTFEAYNCEVIVAGPSSIPGICRGLVQGGVGTLSGIIKWHGGRVDVSGGTVRNICVSNPSSAVSGGIELYGAMLHNGGGGTTNYDLENAVSGTYIKNFGTVRDDNAPIKTFGVITDLSPYNSTVFIASKTDLQQWGNDTQKINFGASDFDPFSIYSTSNSRVTPPPGTYRLQVTLVSLGSRTWNISLYKNGAFYHQMGNTLVWSGSPMLGTIASANGTDYFEVYANTPDGSGGRIAPVGATRFWGERVGPGQITSDAADNQPDPGIGNGGVITRTFTITLAQLQALSGSNGTVTVASLPGSSMIVAWIIKPTESLAAPGLSAATAKLQSDVGAWSASGLDVKQAMGASVFMKTSKTGAITEYPHLFADDTDWMTNTTIGLNVSLTGATFPDLTAGSIKVLLTYINLPEP